MLAPLYVNGMFFELFFTFDHGVTGNPFIDIPLFVYMVSPSIAFSLYIFQERVRYYFAAIGLFVLILIVPIIYTGIYPVAYF